MTNTTATTATEDMRPADSIWSADGWKYRDLYPRHLGRRSGPDRATLKLPHMYTPDFVRLVESETNWLPAPNQMWPAVVPELREPIGLRKMDCPLCNLTLIEYFLWRGQHTQLDIALSQPCRCVMWRGYYPSWSQIPKRYQGVTWASVAPYSGKDMRLSVERQKKIIDFIRAHPEDSYLLYGTYGTGKTHMSVALHQFHLDMWVRESWARSPIYCPIMRANLTKLLDEHHAWKTRGENDSTPRPSIDLPRINGIIKQGDKPVLILDEIDKLGGQPTPFRIETVLCLVDAVYQADGIVIATSNHDEDYFLKTWGEEIGGPVIRRITSGDRAHKIRFEDRKA